MAAAIKKGECVKIPDGRVARVRDKHGDKYRVRVRRKTSKTHQFLFFAAGDLEVVQCPKGWMSPAGYNRYTRVTLKKMKERTSTKSAK
ncbi:MAG TPA: hypothetical protein VFC63_27330 [Blastocatellia bacterium]|nr:hypothetical protein [Blastocatellia bacterium]